MNLIICIVYFCKNQKWQIIYIVSSWYHWIWKFINETICRHLQQILDVGKFSLQKVWTADKIKFRFNIYHVKKERTADY